MQVGSAQSNAVQLQAGAESIGSGEIAERWYGPALALLTISLILMSAAQGYFPVTDSHLAISLVVAILLVIDPFVEPLVQADVAAVDGEDVFALPDLRFAEPAGSATGNIRLPRR